MPALEQLLAAATRPMDALRSWGDRVHAPNASRRSVESGFTLLELVVVIAILAAVAALVVTKVDTLKDEAELTVARATLSTVREAICGSSTAPGYLADMKYLPFFKSVDLRTHDLLSPDSYSDYPAALTFNLVTNRGWRGPYLQRAHGVANTNALRNNQFPAAYERRFTGDFTFAERGFFYASIQSYYGDTDERAVGDPWGNPIVVQVPPVEAFDFSVTDAERFNYARVVSAGADGILTTPRTRLAGMLLDGRSPLRGDDLVFFLNRADVYEEEEAP